MEKTLKRNQILNLITIIVILIMCTVTITNMFWPNLIVFLSMVTIVVVFYTIKFIFAIKDKDTFNIVGNAIVVIIWIVSAILNILL